MRPVPRLAATAPVVQRLPDRLRPYAPWLPHLAVAAVALVLAVVAASGYGTYSGLGYSYHDTTVPASHALVVGVPLLVVLYLPVGGWWLSLAGCAGMAQTDAFDTWPWTQAGFASHLLVMTLAANRVRPRVAAEMWVLTSAVGLYYDWQENGTTDAPHMIISSFVAMLTVVLVRANRESRQEVVKQTAVTAKERSQRTLLEERTTIARELHDVVAHHMSVVAIQAEAAPYRVTDPDPELVRSFATIRENALLALTELRRVLGVVRAADYEAPDAPQPTLAALDGLLDNVRDAGLNVEKIVTGAVRELPQGIELSAYRIVQEALSNVLRHAPGADTRVEISYVLGGLGLRIVNGPARQEILPSPGSGNGLTGMRERVTMLDGHITTQPTDDGGYETTVFLPTPHPTPERAPEEAAGIEEPA
ncbi:histidine kinase [Streptomyces sp. B6B3]|uniref:sensor histidine kinase n=1 Tax=Streptomyces sp. B6B3 TaxID=3153570 RepID=UPI00325F6D8A